MAVSKIQLNQSTPAAATPTEFFHADSTYAVAEVTQMIAFNSGAAAGEYTIYLAPAAVVAGSLTNAHKVDSGSVAAGEGAVITRTLGLVVKGSGAEQKLWVESDVATVNFVGSGTKFT